GSAVGLRRPAPDDRRLLRQPRGLRAGPVLRAERLGVRQGHRALPGQAAEDRQAVGPDVRRDQHGAVEPARHRRRPAQGAPGGRAGTGQGRSDRRRPDVPRANGKVRTVFLASLPILEILDTAIRYDGWEWWSPESVIRKILGFEVP